MKILIACHCKSPTSIGPWASSPKLTFKSDTIDIGNVEISYIDYDEDCPEHGKPLQYSNWEDVPIEEFDYIWFQFCPIWGNRHGFFKISQKGLSLFSDAFRSLKPGGKIIILNHTSEEGDEYDTNIYFEFLREIEATKFTYELTKKNDLPFVMETNRSASNSRKEYVVLTKIESFHDAVMRNYKPKIEGNVSVGGRRQLRSRRRKGKRQSKRKYTLKG